MRATRSTAVSTARRGNDLGTGKLDHLQRRARCSLCRSSRYRCQCGGMRSSRTTVCREIKLSGAARGVVVSRGVGCAAMIVDGRRLISKGGQRMDNVYSDTLFI